MLEQQVTIIVVSREHFSCTRESLESIYNNTDLPFKLVYVDSGSPSSIRDYLAAQAQVRGFHLIRTDYYLFPNQARNLGLSHVSSKYVVFIDNDVIVSPGWLNYLLQYAEDTGASVVGPLICVSKPEHQRVHIAGGEAHIVLEIKSNQHRRRIHAKQYFVDRFVAEVQDQLQRQQCELTEFHCMLVRRDIFQQIGLLDEAILRHKWEQIDFCLTVTYSGGTIHCEPAAIVTYIPKPLFVPSHIPYSIPHRNDDWEFASLNYFYQKWNLTDKDKYFNERFKRLEQRQSQGLLTNIIRQLGFGAPNS